MFKSDPQIILRRDGLQSTYSFPQKLYSSFSGAFRLALDSGGGSPSYSGSVPISRRFSQFAFLLTQMWSAARAGSAPSTRPVGIATTGFPVKTEGSGEPQVLQKDLRYAGGSRRIGASKNEISSSPRSQRKFSARTRNSAANGEPVARWHREQWQ